MADDFADQVSRLAALAEPARRDLYRFVASQPGPVSRDQAAAGVGVPRHTAKFHLDKLVDEGLLTTEFKRLTGRSGPGAGRPTKFYLRSGRDLAVAVPERHYQLAAELMATAIEHSARQGTDVVQSLQQVAAAHGALLARDTPEDLLAELAARGYEPHVEGGTVTLANCPFHVLARRHTDLVCRMNLALLTEAAGDDLSARLDPAEGRCCVTFEPAAGVGPARTG